RVRPVETALAGWPSVRLDAPGATAFGHGQAADVIPAAASAEGYVRVHDAEGPMLGVGELMAGGSKVRPVRILHADRPRTRILPAWRRAERRRARCLRRDPPRPSRHPGDGGKPGATGQAPGDRLHLRPPPDGGTAAGSRPAADHDARGAAHADRRDRD